MNSEQLAGGWRHLKGEAKRQWGKLTDDDLEVIDGKFESLVGKIQQRYGIRKDEAERKARTWMDSAEVPM